MYLKKYRIFYSEHTIHEKVFVASSAQEAIELAKQDLDESYWSTSTWDTRSGEGVQFDVEELDD